MPPYPRIWDRNGERQIVGETKVSWLVKRDYAHSDPLKINKKSPNGTKPKEHWQWFFDEQERQLIVWASTNFNGIKEALGRYSLSVSPETLHRVAEVIGYYPTLNSSQPNSKASGTHAAAGKPE